MTDALDAARDHYRAAGLTERLKAALGPGLAQLSANLGRNLMEGRLGILTAVFEAVSTAAA